MNEPKRLLEEVDSHLARELLNAGRWSPWPPGVRRQRVLTALGVGLAVGTTKKLSFAAMTTWSKVATIGCVVCAGAGGVVAYRAVTNDVPVVVVQQANRNTNELVDTDAPVHVDAINEDEPTEVVSGAQRQIELAVAAKGSAVSAALEPGESAGRATPSRASGLKNERKDSRVRAELTLLEQARSELRSGRSETAVATLGSYAQRFPRGVLALEAEVLRIEALAAAGRTQEATKRAQRVLERNPNSVVASRLKRFEAPR